MVAQQGSTPNTCVLLLLAAFAGACGESAEVREPIVRDSAGIRIVENFDHPVPVMEVTPTPILGIGSATDTLTGLYQVEGAHRLTDGRIVIANRGTNELRFYDADGRFLQGVGRTGQGPGEFESIAWTARCGADTLYVYDIANRRLTVLDDQGNTVRLGQLMLPDNTLPYGRSHCQPGGPFVSAGWASSLPEPGLHRHAMPVGLASLDGEPMRMIGQFPGVDRWGTVRAGQLTGSIPLPLGRDLLETIVNDRVFVGTGDAYEVAVYRLDGTLEMLVRLAVAERSLTDADIAAHIEEQLRGVENAERREQTRRFYLDMDLPTHLPPYAAFIVDAAETLWIQDYAGPRDTEIAWRRFTSDGQYIGVAILPAGLEVFEIGEDYVLGVQRDDLDIEYVQLFGLGTSEEALR